MRGCGPLRPSKDTEAGVIHVDRDPRLVRARAIPATEFSRGAAANVLLIFRDFSQKMPLARFGLECGSLLPLSLAGSLPPAAPRASSRRKSGSKLPHSKKDVKIYGTNPISPLASTKVPEKRTQTKSKRSGKTSLKIRKKAKTNSNSGPQRARI